MTQVRIAGVGMVKFCKPGTQQPYRVMADDSWSTTSGGLMSKGHPLGATGLAQCAELVWHLRGEAGSGIRAGYSHSAQVSPVLRS